MLLDGGALIALVVVAIVGAGVALVGVGFGWRSLNDLMNDRSLRFFGYYVRDTPYKGYNRWHSQAWNMKNTMQ